METLSRRVTIGEDKDPALALIYIVYTVQDFEEEVSQLAWV